MARPLACIALLVAVLGGCGTGGERAGSPAPGADEDRTTTTVEVTWDEPEGPSLADQVVDLGSAAYDEAEHRVEQRAPVALRIDRLGIAGAAVTAVGVDEKGELDVPGPADVGWYRYGPRPGEPGSTVLAAHIAYDGVDGVFRRLDDLRPGDVVVVTMDDGSELTYRVSELEQHPKDALPEAVWAKGGPERLALVTCGGSFDSTRGSYRDNVIAWAVPV